jgi:hypothetical protein
MCVIERQQKKRKMCEKECVCESFVRVLGNEKEKMGERER